MFQFLQPADRPVLAKHELVMGKDQPEYIPLRCLPGNTERGERLSRWTLTPEQRKLIADGADIFLELWTYHQPMNPIRIGVGDPNPDFFESAYRLQESAYRLQEVEVIINGKRVRLPVLEGGTVSYWNIVALAFPDDINRCYSMTFRFFTVPFSGARAMSGAGTLTPGESIKAVPGMVFNVCDTSQS
jgi:hypothetical protein